MMKKQIYIGLFFTITVMLSGCSSLNSNFECSMKPGIRCESLDQVNSRVDSGEIGQPNFNMSCVGGSNNCSNLISSNSFYKDGSCSSQREPLRYGETVMRVWMAPYEDSVGNYHQESDVYSVVKPGHWIGNPPKEANIEG